MNMAYDDPNDAPRSDSMRWYKCDACENLHMIMLDEDQQVIATATATREMVMEMLETIDGEPYNDQRVRAQN